MIVIDTNEFAHDPKKWEPVINMQDNIEFDFIIQGDVACFGVERKEFKDLKASICGDERLWNQCKALRQAKEQGYTVFVACVGSRTEFDTRVRRMVETLTKEQYTGIQIGIARMGVNYIHFDNDAEFIAFLKNLNERSGNKREYLRPTIKKPERTLAEEREDVYCALEGIGRKKAQALLEEFGCPADTIAIAELGVKDEDFRKILGNKSYEHFKEVMLNGRKSPT